MSRRTSSLSRRLKAPINRFSWTVKALIIRRPSGTSTRPARTRRLADKGVTSAPLEIIVPAAMRSMPRSARKNDDLPAPLAPSTVTISPSLTCTDTPRTAWTRPYRTSTSRASSSMAVLLRCRRGAKVDPLHDRIIPDLRQRTFCDLTPEIEYHHVVAQGANKVHIVLDDK